jgi:hypothetical protein
MSRPPRADRPVEIHISLPESIHARLSVLLFSPAEGRIPRGAVSAFIETLIRQAFDRLPLPQEPDHAPLP